MTDNKDFKRIVRTRARKTGESYQAARRNLRPPVAGAAGKPPAHWRMTGSHAHQYSHELDPVDRYQGKPVARLTYTATGEPGGFGATVQVFMAKAYLNQRLRFSAVIRTEAVEEWAGLWLRVDGSNGSVLNFDNTQNRPVTGTADWTPVDVVLDVPPEAQFIYLGMILQGRGSAAVAGMQVDVVDESVPPTAEPPGLAEHPLNLSLEEEA